MIATLVWLTISAPFVLAAQQQASIEQSGNGNTALPDSSEEDTANSPVGATEEKSSSGSNTLTEEYLHELHLQEHLVLIASQYHKSGDDDDYTAFHGELLVPPPNNA